MKNYRKFLKTVGLCLPALLSVPGCGDPKKDTPPNDGGGKPQKTRLEQAKEAADAAKVENDTLIRNIEGFVDQLKEDDKGVFSAKLQGLKGTNVVGDAPAEADTAEKQIEFYNDTKTNLEALKSELEILYSNVYNKLVEYAKADAEATAVAEAKTKVEVFIQNLQDATKLDEIIRALEDVNAVTDDVEKSGLKADVQEAVNFAKVKAAGINTYLNAVQEANRNDVLPKVEAFLADWKNGVLDDFAAENHYDESVLLKEIFGGVAIEEGTTFNDGQASLLNKVFQLEGDDVIAADMEISEDQAESINNYFEI